MAQSSLRKLFSSQRVYVIGDVMLDHYILGKVERISPEAPVPVVAVAGYDDRAGGAANVALNIKACAAETAIFSVVGDDNTAKKLRAVLTKAKVDHKGMIASKERMTTLKARVIGNNHQLLRYDQEDTHELSSKEEQALFKAFSAACNSKKPNAVVLEDYDKGVLTPALIKQVIAYCNKNKIPTLVDPKKKHFFDYSGCSVFKPNLKEMREGLGQAIEPNPPALKKAVEALNKKMPHEATLITLAEHGVFYSDAMNEGVIPAHIRRIADVSGAGDTVVAIAALAVAAKFPMHEVAALSNLAGGLVCEHPGVVSIDIKKLEEEYQ